MKTTPWLLSLALALSVGCRGDDGGSGDGDDGDGNGNADAGPGEDVTIQEVQSDDMAIGTPVTLRGVVVVAVDTFGGRTGGVYVQEPEGGPFSGVLVYVSGTAAADLVPGDLVDVENGVKDEFALQEDETGRTLTEVSPAEGSSITISKVGDGTVPAPEVVNPWDLAASDDEAEKWEGVLVTFENVRVLSRPRNVSSTDDTLSEMEVTGPFRISSSLTSLSDTISSGDCYQSITGIGDYFFSYKILPRNQGDLVGAGDGCLPEETTAALCDDGTDNDYNGFVDCGDYSCDAPTGDETLCEIATSVVGIQNETFDQESGVAVLTDVTITAVSESNFWIQDTDAAGAYNGVQVYGGDDAAGLNVGDRYDLKGRVIEYGSVTEVTSITLGGTIAGGNGADISTVTLAQVTGADAEQWEGVLVTVEDVSVSMPASDMSYGQFVVTDGSDSLHIDDTIHADAEMGAEMNDCYDITGVMHFNISDNHVTLLPRDAGDLADSGGC